VYGEVGVRSYAIPWRRCCPVNGEMRELVSTFDLRFMDPMRARSGFFACIGMMLIRFTVQEFCMKGKRH
jgi:hypothetical protein